MHSIGIDISAQHHAEVNHVPSRVNHVGLELYDILAMAMGAQHPCIGQHQLQNQVEFCSHAISLYYGKFS